MQDVRNAADKLVCRIDKRYKTVEIVVKGYITVIRFFDDGNVRITNARKMR